MRTNFNEGLIGEKLTAQGYEKDTYDSYTYYRINEDMGADNDSELGEFTQSDLNRVSVLDNTLVIAPATDIMTGILDTMSGRGTEAAAATAVMMVMSAPGPKPSANGAHKKTNGGAAKSAALEQGDVRG